MKRRICFIALLLGMSSMAFSQGMGEIRGQIFNASDKTTLPGAGIYIKTGTSFVSCASDKDGNFVLKPLPPGVYTVEVSFTGYQNKVFEGVYVFNDKITPLGNVELTQGIDLPEVVITWKPPLIGIENNFVMPVKEYRNMADKTDLTKVVSNMTSDVMRTDDGALYFRGSRENDFVYIVDGMKMQGDRINIPSVSIGSIQVYTGGVPARYGDFMGGCVVIETQSYFDWLNSQE